MCGFPEKTHFIYYFSIMFCEYDTLEVISHQRVTPSGVCRGTAIYVLQGLTSWKFPLLLSILLVYISFLLLVHIFCDVVVLGGCVHSSILFYGSKCVNCMLLQIMFISKSMLYCLSSTEIWSMRRRLF